jgi:hypothetical protein
MISNSQNTRATLNLTYNDDGSATLATKNTMYEDYDITLVKSLADVFRDKDETEYTFLMCLETPGGSSLEYTWEIILNNTDSTPTLIFDGPLKQDGKQITCMPR